MTQNTITSIDIMQKINNLNNEFKSLVDNSTDRSGYNGYPYVVDKIYEYGVENIFFINKDYKGLYQDDYCTFFYWNNATGEIFTDEWTTAFAAPHYDMYTRNVFTFKEGVELGLIDMTKVKAYNKNLWLEKIKNVDFSDYWKVKKYMENNPVFAPMVKVERGRKWKGIGFLLEVTESVYSWGPSYGRGYNCSSSVTAKILSTEDFQIHYCNANYVEFINTDELFADFSSFAEKRIEVMFSRPDDYFDMNTLTWSIKKGDYLAIYNDLVELWIEQASSDVTNLFSKVRRLEETAFDEKEYEEKKKLAAKRAEKITGITEWVNNSTDKETELGKMSLALHVLAKQF